MIIQRNNLLLIACLLTNLKTTDRNKIATPCDQQALIKIVKKNRKS